jgi:cobalt-zinc-cadmium efflux system membrane fusion protein
MTGKIGTRYALLTTGIVVVACLLTFVLARLSAPVSPAPAAKTETAKIPSQVLQISAENLAAAGIIDEAVRPGNLSSTITAPAMIDAEIRGIAIIGAQVSGMVIRINKRLGDTAKAGEALAVIESRDAGSLAASRDVAESRLRLARSVLARETTLYDQMVTARQDLERAQADVEAAEAEDRRARAAVEAAHVSPDGKSVAVLSPLAGTLTSRTASLGMYVQADTELFRVSDPKFIDIDAAVTGTDAQRIAEGDLGKVTTRAGIVVNAIVRSVSPTVNEETRTANVVLDPLPGEPSLTPGEFVQVEITPKKSIPTGIIVPESAVQNVNGRTVVFVRTATGFRPQPVVLGAHNAGRVSIVSGLEAGTSVATANAFLL